MISVIQLAQMCESVDQCEYCQYTDDCQKFQKVVAEIDISRPDMLNTNIDKLIDVYHGNLI